jgi:uncharacterized membrane protein (DUF485 family)
LAKANIVMNPKYIVIITRLSTIATRDRVRDSIVGSFVLCLVYVVWANRFYDPAVRRIMS